MYDQPLLVALMIVFGIYVMGMWRQDYRDARAGRPSRGALPGAAPAPAAAFAVAVAGALVILALETWGEIRLGLSEQQSTVTLLFGLYTLVAAFIEELIFRGFLVVDRRGAALRWGAALGASVVFAALHPFLWSWEDGSFAWTFNAKGWFSTAAVFASSLWFYAMRFASFNPARSLLPCVAAHAAKNLGVLVVKGVQGHLAGWY